MNYPVCVPEPVTKIVEKLEDHGWQTVLVGGCVRDALSGRIPHDYDLATAAKPETVRDLFDHTVETGIQHGTVTVIEKSMPVEVTTFRHDGEYEDGRHPKQVEYVTSLEEDLKRRDFTINSMAYSLKRGLVDPFGGQKDLQNHLIRAVGDPNLRFEEDALRMLRAFRFAARLGFEIEENTRKAIDDHQDLIRKVSVERIVPEIEEILLTDPQILDQMTGLLKPWVPELEVMLNTEQNSQYHYTDVLHHTLDALSFLKKEPFDPAVAWAVLLHDTGKPSTRTFYNGHDHFNGHPDVSARIALRVVKELKLPRKLQRDIPQLVRYHDSFYKPSLANLYKLRIERGWDDEFLKKLFQVQFADISAHTIQSDRKEQLQTFINFYEEEKNKRPFSVAELAINGKDLQNLGLQGPEVGDVLVAALQYAFYHPEHNEHHVLLEKIRNRTITARRKEKDSARRGKRRAARQ